MPYLTQHTTKDLIARVNRLTAGSQRKWGKMNVMQMLAHCTAAVKIAFAEEAPVKTMSEPIAAFARWMFIDLLPFPKGGVPTAEELDATKKLVVTDDFKYEKQSLIEQIERLTNTADDYYFKPHPVFGRMNRKKWGKLIYKHVDHHLRQFGE